MTNIRYATYQPVQPPTDPVQPNTNQYCLTQSSATKYQPEPPNTYQVTTSTALYRPSTTKYRPVPPSTDPVATSTNQDRPLPLALYTSQYCFREGLKKWKFKMAHAMKGVSRTIKVFSKNIV